MKTRCECGEEIEVLTLSTGKRVKVNLGTVFLCDVEEEKILIGSDGRAFKSKERGASGRELHRDTCPYVPAPGGRRNEGPTRPATRAAEEVRRGSSQGSLKGIEAKAKGTKKWLGG